MTISHAPGVVTLVTAIPQPGFSTELRDTGQSECEFASKAKLTRPTFGPSGSAASSRSLRTRPARIERLARSQDPLANVGRDHRVRVAVSR